MYAVKTYTNAVYFGRYIEGWHMQRIAHGDYWTDYPINCVMSNSLFSSQVCSGCWQWRQCFSCVTWTRTTERTVSVRWLSIMYLLSVYTMYQKTVAHLSL